MIALQTINCLVGQDWTDILGSAADEMSFRFVRATYPDGRPSLWLTPPDPGAPPHRYSNPLNRRHAYFLGQYAVREIHKHVMAAASGDEDRSRAAHEAMPSYLDLLELMRDDQDVVPIDLETRTQAALRAYKRKLADAALTLLDEKGPRAIIALGDIEPFEG